MKYRKLKEIMQKREGPSDNQCKADKVPTHREVVVEKPVRVELGKDLVDKDDSSQSSDKTYKNRSLFWSKISAILLAAYASITLWQAWLTRQLVSNGEQQAHRDLRPYIYADKMDVIGSIDSGEWKGQVEVTNTGKTPGTKVEGCADFAFRLKSRPMTDDLLCPNPDNPATGLPTTGEKSKFVLGFQRPFNLYTSGFSAKVTQNVPPPFNPSVPFGKILATGDFFLYIYGEVTYSDLIDEPIVHKTSFCGRYNPDSKLFDVCEKHNQMK